FLEQLVAEWYESQDYFVRRNVRVGPRPKGGHEGELDIVAFNPALGKLVHIETSMDADPWKERESRFRRKFETGEKYIHSIFKGVSIPEHHEKIAVLGLASRQSHETIGGGKIVLIGDLLHEILTTFKERSWFSKAIPEGYPILRTLQVVIAYKKSLLELFPSGGI
ncbi:MAG TPA: hypothetical protein VJ044_08065, partial [Candidatus Hodarchaeales archaeon]|nr:hypothetical protein [Candidatus Hodarchaeales archaeon]